jgi:hypothetical protein
MAMIYLIYSLLEEVAHLPSCGNLVAIILAESDIYLNFNINGDGWD